MLNKLRQSRDFETDIAIYYCKDEYARDFMFGDFAAFDKSNPEKTHTLLGYVSYNFDLYMDAQAARNILYRELQGEFWSPNGEANSLIRSKGLSHTSMSVGDIIKIGNKFHICKMIGWETV